MEIALAVLLVVGLASRLAAILSVVLLAAFLVGIISAAARGLGIECGCFGGGGDLTGSRATQYTVEILRDVGLLVASAFLAVWPRSRYAADDAIRSSVPGAETRLGPRRTKAAQQRLAKLVTQREAAARRRLQLTSVACGLVVVAVALAGVGIQSSRVGNVGSGPTPQAVSADHGVTLGRSSAQVTVVLYEDLQCPVCKQFESSAGPVLKQFLDGGRVKAEYHIVSYLNRASSTQYSSRAANAAYCAADAGEFQKYHDILYQNQPPEGSAGLSDAQLVSYGEQVGITGNAFSQCVLQHKYADFVSKVSDQASQNGVVGTPTVLVNGTQLQGLDGASLRASITSALG